MNQIEVITSVDNTDYHADEALKKWRDAIREYLKGFNTSIYSAKENKLLFSLFSDVLTNINNRVSMLITACSEDEISDEALVLIFGEATVKMFQQPVLRSRHAEVFMTRNMEEFSAERIKNLSKQINSMEQAAD